MTSLRPLHIAICLFFTVGRERSGMDLWVWEVETLYINPVSEVQL